MSATYTDRLQGLSTSVAVKAPCRLKTTGNHSLSGLAPVDDGTPAEGDRILVGSNTNASENGIYNASASSWVRAEDFNGSLDVVGGTIVGVNEGALGGGKTWRVTGDGEIVVGTDDIEFEPAVVGAASGISTSIEGRTADDLFTGLPDIYLQPSFEVANLIARCDSFALQPSEAESFPQQYADLYGLAEADVDIIGVSGQTTADMQASVLGETSLAATDHTLIEGGTNDLHFIGSGDVRVHYGDFVRRVLANAVWMGTPAGTNKIAAASATAGQLAVSGSWSADSDLPGAFKTTSNGAAMQATFTNCRWGVLLYKVKVGSTGVMDVKPLGQDDQIQRFLTKPDASSVPSNVSPSPLTYAMFARVFDFGEQLPTAKLQVVTVGTGQVSIIGFVGFSGAQMAGPRLALCDIPTRGALGYALASGVESNLPILNRGIYQVMAQCLALGMNVFQFPLATALRPASDLQADDLHPTAAGAVRAASYGYAAQAGQQSLAAVRPDLYFLGCLFNSGGDFAPGLPVLLDRQLRVRLGRIGGSGLDFTEDNEARATTGVKIVPILSNVPVPAKGIHIFPDGNAGFIQALFGYLGLGSPAGNKVRVTDDEMRPEDNNAYDNGRSDAQWKRVYVGPAGVLVSGVKVLGAQGAAIADPAGGATVDAEARTAIGLILARMRASSPSIAT